MAALMFSEVTDTNTYTHRLYSLIRLMWKTTLGIQQVCSSVNLPAWIFQSSVSPSQCRSQVTDGKGKAGLESCMFFYRHKVAHCQLRKLTFQLWKCSCCFQEKLHGSKPTPASPEKYCVIQRAAFQGAAAHMAHRPSLPTDDDDNNNIRAIF